MILSTFSISLLALCVSYPNVFGEMSTQVLYPFFNLMLNEGQENVVYTYNVILFSLCVNAGSSIVTNTPLCGEMPIMEEAASCRGAAGAMEISVPFSFAASLKLVLSK